MSRASFSEKYRLDLKPIYELRAKMREEIARLHGQIEGLDTALRILEEDGENQGNTEQKQTDTRENRLDQNPPSSRFMNPKDRRSGK